MSLLTIQGYTDDSRALLRVQLIPEKPGFTVDETYSRVQGVMDTPD